MANKCTALAASWRPFCSEAPGRWEELSPSFPSRITFCRSKTHWVAFSVINSVTECFHSYSQIVHLLTELQVSTRQRLKDPENPLLFSSVCRFLRSLLVIFTWSHSLFPVLIRPRVLLCAPGMPAVSAPARKLHVPKPLALSWWRLFHSQRLPSSHPLKSILFSLWTFLRSSQGCVCFLNSSKPLKGAKTCPHSSLHAADNQHLIVAWRLMMALTFLNHLNNSDTSFKRNTLSKYSFWPWEKNTRMIILTWVIFVP